MRILITGKNGQVGTELSRLYHPRGDVVLTGRDECDLSSEQSIRDPVERVKPTVIINAGAYTAVDQAEKERRPLLCHQRPRTPGPGPGGRPPGALLIHYSTDYVFNGEKAGPTSKPIPSSPVNVYGESKAAGEAAIAEAATRYLVLRTSWVYGAHGKNFLRTMLRLGAERPELRVVDDQLGAPTSAAAIASATARLVEQSLRSVRPGNLSHDRRRLDFLVWFCPRHFRRRRARYSTRGCNLSRPRTIQPQPDGRRTPYFRTISSRMLSVSGCPPGSNS